MKKLLVVLLSLGLLVAFGMTASAADVKFSGQYYIVGLYESNRTLQDTDKTYSRAAFWQRTRIRTDFQIAEGLTFTTRFDAFEKQWGALNRTSGSATDDKSNSGTVRSVGTTLQENIEMEYGYINFKTKIGSFQIGYQATDEWGTVFADIPGSRPRAIYSVPFGPLTVLALYEKMVESDTVSPIRDTTVVAAGGAAQTVNLTAGDSAPSGKTDADFDRYMLAGIYKFKGGDAGLLWVYNTSALTRLSTTAPYRIQIHRLSPYVKATFGPVYIESEFVYDFGKARKYDNAGTGTDRDKEGIGAYVNAKYSIGPAYLGFQFGYSSGQDPDKLTGNDQKDQTGPISTTAWVPTMFFANHNMRSWVYGSNYGGGGTTPDYGTTKVNFVLFSLYGGYNATSKLLFETALTNMSADKKPAGYDSKSYGTEFDVKATYKIYDNLTYMVGAGYMWTGDYFKGTNVNNVVGNDYVLLNQLTLNF